MVQRWACHGAPPGALIAQDGITSYQFSLSFPNGGEYSFWMLNFASTPATVKFDLTTPIVITSTILSGSPAQSISSVPLSGFKSFGNLEMIVIVAIVALASSALIFARRKKSSRSVLVPKQENGPTAQISERPVPVSEAIISTGYADLDETLEGGLPRGLAVVIVSPSYDERDLLLRKTIDSTLSSGRPAFYVSNDMGRIQDLVRRYSDGFYAFSTQADKILTHPANLYKIPGVENLSDASISLSLAIRDARSKEKAGNIVIIVDILSDILLRHKSTTTRKWLLDFLGKRKVEGFTIIATLNPLATAKEETQTIVDCFDGVIEIYEKSLAERTRRFLIVKKMYGRKYSEDEILIDKDKLF